MLRFWMWARYPQAVLIEGGRSVTECSEALARMTRRSFFSRSPQNRKPFVGKVDRGGGKIWFGTRYGLNPCRALKFALEETEHGCVLRGELEVLKPIRIFSGIYFVFATVGSIIEIAFSIAHADHVNWLYELRLLTQGFVAAFVFMFGYNGLCVLVGNRRERLGIKVVRHVMSSAQAEAVVTDLLAT